MMKSIVSFARRLHLKCALVDTKCRLAQIAADDSLAKRVIARRVTLLQDQLRKLEAQ